MHPYTKKVVMTAISLDIIMFANMISAFLIPFALGSRRLQVVRTMVTPTPCSAKATDFLKKVTRRLDGPVNKGHAGHDMHDRY